MEEKNDSLPEMHWRSRKVPARTTAACKPSTHCHHLPALFVIFIWGNVFPICLPYFVDHLWKHCQTICAGWGLALLSLSTVTRLRNVSKVEGTLYNLYPHPLLNQLKTRPCIMTHSKCATTEGTNVSLLAPTTTCSQQYRYMWYARCCKQAYHVSLRTFWWPLTVYSLISLSHNVVQLFILLYA